jgi:DNA-binding response OmpR family regulator
MHVVSAWQKQDVARQFTAAEPGLVILDLRLGQEDGLDLLREIRSRSDVPVIITAGHRRDEIDRVVAPTRRRNSRYGRKRRSRPSRPSWNTYGSM